MSGFFSEFKLAAAQAPRIYFAPVVGAIRAVLNEMRVEPPRQGPTATQWQVSKRKSRNRRLAGKKSHRAG